ncbi:MAG: DUF202 domain-containing protein [Rhodanobacteraceae bacterium]|nr:DUF202 domain-containing protein [Pseudomonadota bacterium]
MISRFTDYAANERTYLAWVRTAIAILAFGFLVERFDLFLTYLGHSTGIATGAHRSHAAQIVGLALMALALLIIVASTVRFLHHRKTIACEETKDYGTTLGDALLAILLICFGIFLVVYVIQQLGTL